MKLRIVWWLIGEMRRRQQSHCGLINALDFHKKKRLGQRSSCLGFGMMSFNA
jgi:hypothetical protein